MRSSYTSVAAIVLSLFLAQLAVSQDAGITPKPIAVGDSLKVTVVEGKSLHFEFDGKVSSIVEDVATISTANKTAVINRRVPYLCYLPIVGERFFTSTVRRPMQVTQEIRIEIQR